MSTARFARVYQWHFATKLMRISLPLDASGPNWILWWLLEFSWKRIYEFIISFGVFLRVRPIN